MQVLIILAHGSRKKSVKKEIQSLVTNIQKPILNKYQFVTYAFLELTTPSIKDVIEKNSQLFLANTKIDIFPYFLTFGTHVENDLPKVIDSLKEKNPHYHFHILPYLGGLLLNGELIIKTILKN